MGKFKSIISCLLSFSLVFSGIQLRAEETDDNEDIFAALKNSMGAVSAESPVQDKTDEALAAVFGGVDSVIEKSSVPLASITPKLVTQARAAIASTPVSSNIDSDFISQGAPLSILLWGDSQQVLQDSLTNIVKRLYSDKDPRSFRFVVNSDPVPWMNVEYVDLNIGLRTKETRDYETKKARYDNQDSKFPTNIQRPIPPDVPVKMGAVVEISAGQIASVKNLDELAARLAYYLAKNNPKVYGIVQDPRFMQNQELIVLINQMVESSQNADAGKIKKTRDDIEAEFAAIERLAAAEFYPWALYQYEHREFTWLADVYLKSPNHFIGRHLIGAGATKYQLDDWSRPVRLLAQSTYMGLLQGSERGKSLQMAETPLPKPLARLRFLMKCYTEPFYFGMRIQGTLLLTASIGVTQYFFPEVAHWALSAVHLAGSVPDAATVVQTASVQDVPQAAQAIPVVQELPSGPTVSEQVGDLVTKVKGMTQNLMESTFLTSSDKTSDGVPTTAGQFFTEYRYALGAAAAVITGGIIAKSSGVLGEIMHSLSRSQELEKVDRQARRRKKIQEEGPEDWSDAAAPLIQGTVEKGPGQGVNVTISNVGVPEDSLDSKGNANLNNGDDREDTDWSARSRGLYERGIKVVNGAQDAIRSGFNFIVVGPGRIRRSTQKKMHAFAVNGREYTRRQQKAFLDSIGQFKEDWQRNAELRAEQAEINREARLEKKAADQAAKIEQDIVDKAAKIERDTEKAAQKEAAKIERDSQKKLKQEARLAAKAAKKIEDEKQRVARLAQNEIDKAARKVKSDENRERRRLARIENAKRRKEFFIALGAKTLESWETFDRVATSIPERSLVGMTIGLQFGAQTAKNARKRGNTFLFEYIPNRGQAAKDGIREAVANTAAGIEDYKIKRKEGIRFRNDRNTRIARAKLKLELFLEDDSQISTPLFDTLKDIVIAFNNPDNHAHQTIAEKWAIDIKSYKNKDIADLYFRFLKRWVFQAELYGAPDNEIAKMAELFNSGFSKIETKNITREHQVIGVKFLEFMMAKGGSYSQKYVKAIQARSDLAGISNNNGDARWRLSAIIGSTPSPDDVGSYYNDFLSAMNSFRLIGLTPEDHESAGALVVDALGSARQEEKNTVARRLYSKKEKEVIAWLGQPQRSDAQIRRFLVSMKDKYKARYNYPFSHLSLGSALKDIQPLGAIRILQAAKPLGLGQEHSEYKTGFDSFNNQMDSFLNGRIDSTFNEWMSRAKSVSELAAIVDEETKKYSVDPKLFQTRFYNRMNDLSNLITSVEDFHVLYSKEYFWAPGTGQEEVAPLEKPLKVLLDSKRAQYSNSPIWMFDPILSERIHSTTMRQLISLKAYPNTYDGVVSLWKEMTSRGVSTVTDDILSSLIKTGTHQQIEQLETHAVAEGRLFDQVARDEFAIRQIKRSIQYNLLMSNLTASVTERIVNLNSFLLSAQYIMRDMGIRYAKFLEDLSVDMNSTYAEAQIIENAKRNRIVTFATNATSSEIKDSRISMFEQILTHVKEWKPANQLKFMLYLRGNIDSDDFIKSQFPKFGPERIRKIYQGLPLEAAMGVSALYLQATLLSRKGPNEGYGKKLSEYIISQGANDETLTYARLLLKGLLQGLEDSGNQGFQLNVLSALVAMKPEHNKGNSVEGNNKDSKVSIGETIKVILEKFPGVGPKIGQFLVGTNRLPKEINDILIGTQDKSLPPTRFQMFSDLASIVDRGQDIGIELGDLLGAGSLKYSTLGRMNGKPVALQIFRETVQNNVDYQIAALHGMIDDLIKRGGREWGFLRVIVDGAVNAVQREKQYLEEAAKTKIAREKLYVGFNDDSFLITVPKQIQLNKRLLVSDYAKGISFKDKDFPDEDKLPVGLKLLEMEAKILYGTSSGTITYDTDRHAGNYLIDIQKDEATGKKKYHISPIDFGQLTTIKTTQRDRIERLFSYAALLGQFGHNDWLIEKVASEFGLTGKNRKMLEENLKAYFPLSKAGGSNMDKSGGGKDGKAITDYFSLIAAVNETFRDSKNKVTGVRNDADVANLDPDLRTGKLDFAYTDFVRAIIQLNQYEDVIDVPKHIQTPSKILSDRVKDKVAEHLKEMKLSRWQELGVLKNNAERWVRAKIDGEKFEPILVRPTRQQLDQFSVIGSNRSKPVSRSAFVGQCLKFYNITGVH